MDFGGQRMARVLVIALAHCGLRDFTAEDAENAEGVRSGLWCCWVWFWVWLTANGQLLIAEFRMLSLNTAIVCLLLWAGGLLVRARSGGDTLGVPAGFWVLLLFLAPRFASGFGFRFG
jgi:hypothetical protein